MYQIHNKEGLIQNTDTMQVFPPVKENREGRKYLAWKVKGNSPELMAEPQELLPNPLPAEIDSATTITGLKIIMKKMIDPEAE